MERKKEDYTSYFPKLRNVEPEEIQVGAQLIWIYEPRGWYGYMRQVDAIVVKIYPTKIGIAAYKKTGEWEPVKVERHKLLLEK